MDRRTIGAILLMMAIAVAPALFLKKPARGAAVGQRGSGADTTLVADSARHSPPSPDRVTLPRQDSATVGRTAPPPKGTTPNVAGWVMAEAYSHEVSSCGFWPGNGGYGRAAFYVYAYPEPTGYGSTRLATTDAFYDEGLGQFILPYDAVHGASDPDKLLLGFLQETYAAAAELANWDRKALEREGAPHDKA